MRFIIVFLFALSLQFSGFGQDKPAYLIFNEQGKKVRYNKMIDKMAEADVVLLGELHNNPIAHWLQISITTDLYAVQPNLVLGAEMFEADDQVVMDEYLKGWIQERHFTKEAKLWNNYSTDYKPLVEFARQKDLPFVATNVPRRYASLVARAGVDTLHNLSSSSKTWLAPLPVEVDTATPGYAEMLKMGMGHGMGMDPMNMVSAQAVKDATMAHFILKNLPEEGIFIHYQGDYHSANRGGIYWYLKRANPDLNIVVLSSNLSKHMVWDDGLKERADFIVIIPENMTTTY